MILVPASLLYPGIRRVLGYSSPCFHCPPHPCGAAAESCSPCSSDREWCWGAMSQSPLVSEQCQFPTTPVCSPLLMWSVLPADSSCPWKGTNTAQRGRSRGRRTWLQQQGKGTGAGTALVGRPWCRHRWAHQADSEGHPTAVTIPRWYPSPQRLGGMCTQSLSLSTTQAGARCHQCSQAPLFPIQLQRTVRTLTDTHNSSSEAERYYNQQIMITSILQMGKQWPKWIKPIWHDESDTEWQGEIGSAWLTNCAGVHQSEAAVSAMSKWFANNCFNLWTVKKVCPRIPSYWR